MKFNSIKLVFCLLLFFPQISTASVSYNTKLTAYHSPTPGGIAIIPLPITNNNPPIVTYAGNRVLTIKNTKSTNGRQNISSWIAIVGIPVSSQPGIQSIKLHDPNGKAQNITFKVTPRSYKIERINFKGYRPAKHKTPALIKLERRILRELKEIETTYRHWLNVHNISNIQLQLPIHGRKSSTFGLKRILNGIPKNPHSGLDLAAPEGTPVKAPMAGTVIKTSRYFLTGNAVFIEHGQGFITSYFHLKKISVKIGSKIKKGEIICLVGRTGRATGPHLHWSVSLNGARVDPELFLPRKK